MAHLDDDDDDVCQVCLEAPLGQYVMCRTCGYSFCRGCNAKLPVRTCPQCQSALPPTHRMTRDRVRETCAATQPRVCRFCDAPIERANLERHELRCPERTWECRAACGWTGKYFEKKAHERTCVHVVAERLLAPMRTEIAALSRRVVELEGQLTALKGAATQSECAAVTIRSEVAKNARAAATMRRAIGALKGRMAKALR